MSTMPPPPPQQGMSAFAKWLIGCTVGCFLLALVSCGGIFALGYWASKSVAGRVEKMSAAHDAQKARAAEINQLDQAHPPLLPEDVAFAQITEDDIARYLRVRRELSGAMQALSGAIEGIPLANPESLGDKPSVREIYGAIKGTVDGIGDAQAAHLALLDAAAGVLAREGMGPTDLSRMAEIVEWRYLQRPEATLLGLPVFRRREIVELQMEVRSLSGLVAKPAGTEGLEGMSRADADQNLESARTRLAEITEEASRNVGILEPTRAVLDLQRLELEALPIAGLAAIAPLSADTPWMEGLGASGGIGREGHWKWSSGTSHEAPATPAEPPITPAEPPITPAEPPGATGP